MSARILLAEDDEHDAFFSHVKPDDLEQLDVFARTIRDAWLNANRPLRQMPELPGELRPRPRVSDRQDPAPPIYCATKRVSAIPFVL